MDFQVVFTTLAIVISVTGNGLYIRDLIRTKTKPHSISWLIWAILDGIIFAGLMSSGGGIASFAVLTNGLCAFFIFIFSLWRGEKTIVAFDWFCLGGAILALMLWIATQRPLLSIVISIIVALIGFLPTIRKSIEKPYEETVSYYVLQGTRSFFIFLALEESSLTTCIDPITFTIVNYGFALMLILLRNHAVQKT